MKLGYSCWGFLGDGIIDTPDGGRSHRLTLIKELISQGMDIIMLQKNRDLIEAQQNFSNKHISYYSNFPEIDGLFLEYRWKIPGRNSNTNKRNKNYTPDLDRQKELLRYYVNKNIPVLIWDKDQKLNKKSKNKKNIIVLEATLKSKPHRKSLLLPLDKFKTEKSLKEIKNYSKNNKNYKLIYIGNQYERDKDFKEFIDLPARKLGSDTLIFGNWNKYKQRYKKNLKIFPHVNFKGRIGYNKINSIYKKSFATVLIAPDRYYNTGQYTQRLFESLWGLCIPLTPKKYYGINNVIIEEWRVGTGRDVVKKIKIISKQSDNTIKKNFKRQFELLKIFNAKSQAKTILDEINNFYGKNNKRSK